MAKKHSRKSGLTAKERQALTAQYRRTPRGHVRVEFYRSISRRGGFGWRVRASNGRIIADGAETYVNKCGAAKGFAVMADAILNHAVVFDFRKLRKRGVK